MIILYGGGEKFGLPEFSPYVTKTEVQLQMAGLDYEKRPAPQGAAPKGQMPWIDDDGERIGDSHFIRMHLERKYGVDLDCGLDDLARAQGWAIERMLENHLGWASAYFRFMDPVNFAKGPSHFFDGAPEAMRPQLIEQMRTQVAANIKAVGIGRHGEDEIAGLGERSLRALSVLLGDKPYLFGHTPSGVDATLFATLAAVTTPFFASPLRDRAEALPNLTAYVARGMARHYPGFAWG